LSRPFRPLELIASDSQAGGHPAGAGLPSARAVPVPAFQAARSGEKPIIPLKLKPGATRLRRFVAVVELVARQLEAAKRRRRVATGFTPWKTGFSMEAAKRRRRVATGFTPWETRLFTQAPNGAQANVVAGCGFRQIHSL